MSSNSQKMSKEELAKAKMDMLIYGTTAYKEEDGKITHVPIESIYLTPLELLKQRLKDIGGCSDGYCQIIRPVGMHTNGGCRCLRNDKYKAERVLSAYKTYIRDIEGRESQMQPGSKKANPIVQVDLNGTGY